VGFNHCGLNQQKGDLAGNCMLLPEAWQCGQPESSMLPLPKRKQHEERWREQQPEMEISCPALGAVAMEHLDLSSFVFCIIFHGQV
jgi:hypothetical protein